ncbi:unnamed protein product [Closterium sp. Yama58-4]|nr:unnamed protein product [Closterium sp. Yama58-4]
MLHFPVGRSEDAFSILVATDNHLGFMEKDDVRRHDSFTAFEEICKLAHRSVRLVSMCAHVHVCPGMHVTAQVDFLLLGGDLFHDNKPSRATLVRTIDILRRYCLSDNPVRFQVVSDQTLNFPNSFGHVNYEDEHYNVGMPVFTVHGNHDDPAGIDNLSAVDILSSCNLVNYFGKSNMPEHDAAHITLHPVLLRKGANRIALYGLGYMRDERLKMIMDNPQGLQWIRPDEPGTSEDDWFNILVVHQNRAVRMTGTKKVVTVDESGFASFLDLVVWGHEHECRIEPEQPARARYFISQPGSSVVTQLAEGEAKPKHVLHLRVQGNNFKTQNIALTTPRPFEYAEVALRDAQAQGVNARDPEELALFLSNTVQRMIAKAESSYRERRAAQLPEGLLEGGGSGGAREGPVPLPLIRIRVDYSGFSTINSQRFGQQFVGKVGAMWNTVGQGGCNVEHGGARKPATSVVEVGEERVVQPDELNQSNIEQLLRDSNVGSMGWSCCPHAASLLHVLTCPSPYSMCSRAPLPPPSLYSLRLLHPLPLLTSRPYLSPLHPLLFPHTPPPLPASKKLEVLSLGGLAEALHGFVGRDEKHAFSSFLSSALSDTQVGMAGEGAGGRGGEGRRGHSATRGAARAAGGGGEQRVLQVGEGSSACCRWGRGAARAAGGGGEQRVLQDMEKRGSAAAPGHGAADAGAAQPMPDVSAVDMDAPKQGGAHWGGEGEDRDGANEGDEWEDDEWEQGSKGRGGKGRGGRGRGRGSAKGAAGDGVSLRGGRGGRGRGASSKGGAGGRGMKQATFESMGLRGRCDGRQTGHVVRWEADRACGAMGGRQGMWWDGRQTGHVVGWEADRACGGMGGRQGMWWDGRQTGHVVGWEADRACGGMGGRQGMWWDGGTAAAATAAGGRAAASVGSTRVQVEEEEEEEEDDDTGAHGAQGAHGMMGAPRGADGMTAGRGVGDDDMGEKAEEEAAVGVGSRLHTLTTWQQVWKSKAVKPI